MLEHGGKRFRRGLADVNIPVIGFEGLDLELCLLKINMQFSKPVKYSHGPVHIQNVLPYGWQTTNLGTETEFEGV